MVMSISNSSSVPQLLFFLTFRENAFAHNESGFVLAVLLH